MVVALPSPAAAMTRPITNVKITINGRCPETVHRGRVFDQRLEDGIDLTKCTVNALFPVLNEAWSKFNRSAAAGQRTLRMPAICTGQLRSR